MYRYRQYLVTHQSPGTTYLLYYVTGRWVSGIPPYTMVPITLLHLHTGNYDIISILVHGAASRICTILRVPYNG